METKYTPSLIAESSILFSIPLYQRLFEWEESQINQLLKDLKAGFEKQPEEPYYIGLLTVHKKDLVDLVDGQQRFTVLMLLAIALDWDKSFTFYNDTLRLKFRSRSKDATYLESKVLDKNAKQEYENSRMEDGIKYISDFIEKELPNKKSDFSKYVFEHLTFFISCLPEDYKPQNLNQYFEAMNATGRGLESHEILKVNLLKNIDPANSQEFTKIWNLVSDMDKSLIRQRYSTTDNNISDFKERQKLALKDLNNNHLLFGHCNDSIKVTSNLETTFSKIRDISPSNDAPKIHIRSVGERAILSFPEFLLQVLWLQLNDEQKDKTSDFFNVHKLQETFKCLKAEDTDLFFTNLLKYRILLDYFIIRISNTDSNTATYTLAFKEDDTDTIVIEQLIKYQSMLYVSTSSHIWLTEVFNYLEKDALNINVTDFYNQLVKLDNQRQDKVDTISFRYGDINRYWFWRLDYYLWLNNYFKGEAFNVAKNYEFRTNRSIEHIAPQKSQDNSSVSFNDDLLHWFGNLAMISSGQNSSLQNESYEIKKAHVLSFIRKSKNGTIESLKLLNAFEDEHATWDEKRVIDHGNEMIQVLIDSFPTEDFGKIRWLLEKEKK